MASTISSLGLGSSGVLTNDVLDKLRAVDNAAQITPIDTKITANTTKQSDLSILTTLTATLKSSTSTLSDEMSYLKRTTTTSNEAVSVTAASGSAIQNFSIHVNELAKNDIYQSTGFASNSTALGLATDTLKIKLDGISYSIDTTSTMTLTDLKEKITDSTNGKMTLSVLNTGDTTNPYRLTLKANEMGTNNTLDFSQTSSTLLTALGLDVTTNHLQTASDSSFTYNGVTIKRTTNTISDLAVGLSITLNEKQTDATVFTNVSIKQDLTDVKDNLASLVSAYNELMSNLNETTKYDIETKASGSFQSVSQIKALKSSINTQLLSVDEKGRSLIDYGITLNESGILEFDSSVFNTKLTESASDVEDFLRGSTDPSTEISRNGIFKNFNNLLDSYVTGDSSILNLFKTSLITEKTSLTKERLKNIASLDARYDTMSQRFAAYDSIISKLQNQFSSLSLMINQSTSSSS